MVKGIRIFKIGKIKYEVEEHKLSYIQEQAKKSAISWVEDD